MDAEVTAENLKDLGNKSVQEKQYTRAILHYTHAIKLDSTNHVLYSNRSYAFLCEQQYYLALEDANETIRLCPNWAKGYFRKGEVEFAAYHYLEACHSYKKALELQPDDKTILEALNRASKEALKAHKAYETIPWLGAGIGLIVGVIIMISDYVFTINPTHPILMSFVTIMVAMIGYGLARVYRFFDKSSKTGLLDPPPGLGLNDDDDDAEECEDEIMYHKSFRPLTRAQARQRFKRGKL